MPMAVYRQV
uniref:Uncharacterized protein n=1 Tax=Rhizophora mucronata TaxID=61149 RepID=A0A2P2R3M8_RHIMU